MRINIILFFSFFVLGGKAQNPITSDGIHIPEIEGGYGKELADYFIKLKKLVSLNDSLQIQNQIFYPLHASIEGYHGTIDIYDKKSFLKMYGILFNERMKKYILSENLEKVFSNYQGIALGKGRIWIDQRLINGKLITKIFSISNQNVYWQ